MEKNSINTNATENQSGNSLSVGKKPKRTILTRRNLTIFVIILVILLGGALAYTLYVTRSTAFIIDGKHYSKDEVREITRYERDLSEEQSKRRLYDLLTRKRAGEKLGIELKKSDIEMHESQIAEVSNRGKTPWIKAQAYDIALESYLDSAQPLESAKYAPGYVFVFDFSSKIPFDYGDPVEGSENVGDKDMIENDRKYAWDRASHFRNQLKDNKITPDQVLDEIKKDKRLMDASSFSGNYSFKLSEANNEDPTKTVPIVVANQIADKGMKKGVSDIFAGQIATRYNEKGDAYDFVDSMYYFMLMESDAEAGLLEDNFQKTYTKLIKKGKVY